MAFTTAELAACKKLIELGIEEDLGECGDLTSQAVIPPQLLGQAVFVARVDGIVAGLPAVELTCAAIDAGLHFTALLEDGEPVHQGRQLATLAGPMRSLLMAERLALNFMQRLSGVATLTSAFVKAIAGLRAIVLDTRKTTPGWRLLEKYAVRAGGGHNHRIGLWDGILIKDNHLAATGADTSAAQVVMKAVEVARGKVPVEVEVESLDQLRQVLAVKPNIVLLDNMKLEEMRAAVTIRNETALDVQLEASGGVTLATIRAIAETGVDGISVGALTHSAPALDIALDYLPK